MTNKTDADVFHMKLCKLRTRPIRTAVINDHEFRVRYPKLQKFFHDIDQTIGHFVFAIPHGNNDRQRLGREGKDHGEMKVDE